MDNNFFTANTVKWIGSVAFIQSVTILLLCFNLVSFSLPYADSIRPFFVLMPIYYWSVFRPTLVFPVYVFALGLCIDFISHFPIGLHAGLFLVVHYVMKKQRLFLMGQPYPMVWLGFAIVSTSVYSIQWLLFSALTLDFPPIMTVMASNILSILFFPIIATFLAFLHKIFPDDTSKSF